MFDLSPSLRFPMKDLIDLETKYLDFNAFFSKKNHDAHAKIVVKIITAIK